MSTKEFYENLYKGDVEMSEIKEEIRRLRVSQNRMLERDKRREEELREVKLRLYQLESYSKGVCASL